MTAASLTAALSRGSHAHERGVLPRSQTLNILLEPSAAKRPRRERNFFPRVGDFGREAGRSRRVNSVPSASTAEWFRASSLTRTDLSRDAGLQRGEADPDRATWGRH